MNYEEQKSQLKLLIAKGKEQGFLTYHEVNDHLPDDIVDPEQIESIVGMINDMGIEVHEFAPDVDTLLISEAPPPDEDVAEEAVAALTSVDSEFGRTTDPVRMYMREMGTVDLLTREGEIKIAKRIEEGLSQALSALATHPGIIEEFLKQYDRIAAEEIKLSDLITGFTDHLSAEELVDLEAEYAKDAKEVDELDEVELDEVDVDEHPSMEEINLDTEEASYRFMRLRELYSRLMATKDQAEYQSLRKETADYFLQFKLVPRLIDDLTEKLRETVTFIREHENQIRDLCVLKIGIDKKEFLASFKSNMTNPRWIASLLASNKPFTTALRQHAEKLA
jgi:RNA polymerase primary sigma factor